MIYCPVCGHENADGSDRCTNPECGYEFHTSPDKQKTRLMDDAGTVLGDGHLISDRYEIVKELGRGGMGVVYLVKDNKLRGREVALKMIHPELITHEEARQRFTDEVLLCRDLHHPNIVFVYHLEESDRSLFFTMEYIPGQSLRQLMDERQDQVPPFTLDEACTVVTQILDALAYAHQTTIHRDIKPENILVQGQFPQVQVKVLDFGIAKVLSASRFTRTAQSMGTAYYMSPEQMQGAKKIDQRSDLYSVGMVFYEMLTGVIAAGRFELPGEIIKGLPPELDKFIEKVLSPRPEIRFDSARSTMQALLPMPESARKATAETLNRTVMDLLSKAAFDQARERIKQSGLSAATLLDKVREIEEKYSAHMDKGTTFLSADDFQAAREQFKSALGICPDAEGPRTSIRKVDDAVNIEQKKQMQYRAKQEAREKERQEQAVREKAQSEKQIHEAIVLCDESITRADFDAAKQNLVRAEAIDKENPVCARARVHLEKTESQYNNYIDQAVEAMASRDRMLAEDNINKALDICPNSDKADQLKMELENTGSVSSTKKFIFLSFFVLGFIVVAAYFMVKPSSQHAPANTGKINQAATGAKTSHTNKLAAPVKIKQGSLNVTSTPGSAIVTVNGREKGATPLEIKGLNPGNVKVKARLDGYLTQFRTVDVAAGAKAALHFDLQERNKKGTLTVNTTPEGSRVRILNIQPRYENGMELNPGRYRIEVSCSGYTTRTRWIELGANEDKQILVELKKSGKHSPIWAVPAASKFEKQAPIAATSPGEKQPLVHNDADAPAGTAMVGYPVVKSIQVKKSPFSVMVNMTGKAPVKVIRVGEEKVMVAIKNVSLAKGFVIGGKDNPNLESVHVETLKGNVVVLMVTGKHAFEEKIKFSFNASNNQLTVILNKAVKPASPVPKSGKQALAPATDAQVTMMRLAEIYQKNGESDRCIKEIEKLLSTNPTGDLRYEAVKLMQKAYDALFNEQLRNESEITLPGRAGV